MATQSQIVTSQNASVKAGAKEGRSPRANCILMGGGPRANCLVMQLVPNWWHKCYFTVSESSTVTEVANISLHVVRLLMDWWSNTTLMIDRVLLLRIVTYYVFTGFYLIYYLNNDELAPT